MRSGFVTLVGRPNVGKSTLVNAICGKKISIVSDKPQTTRRQVRGILTRPDSQIVFVDTPGLHKPVSALGERVNAAAIESISDVDVACLVLDATMPFGSGDQWVADRLDLSKTIVIVNKTDVASKKQVVNHLIASSGLDALAYFPISAKSGHGVADLVAHILERMPEGPMYYPDDVVSDLLKQPLSLSWFENNYLLQLMTNFRTRSPQLSPSGNGRVFVAKLLLNAKAKKEWLLARAEQF